MNQSHKYILLIETATEICSVAIGCYINRDNYNIVDELTIDKSMSHSEVLTVAIATLIAKHNLPFKDFSAIAISGGPGTYTGLRIGFATAKGIAFGSNIKLIVVDTLRSWIDFGLQNLKNVQRNEKIKDNNITHICAVMSSRRMEVIYGITAINNPSTPTISTISKISELGLMDNNIFFIGNGVTKLQEMNPNIALQFLNSFKVRASLLLPNAIQLHLEGEYTHLHNATPMYIRAFGQ